MWLLCASRNLRSFSIFFVALKTGLSVRGCGVVKAQLHAGATLPCVQLEPSCEMKPCTAVILKGGPEGCIKGSKGDGLKAWARAVRERNFKMPRTDLLGEVNYAIGKGKAGTSGRRTVGTSIVELLDKMLVGGSGHQCAVKF